MGRLLSSFSQTCLMSRTRGWKSSEGGTRKQTCPLFKPRTATRSQRRRVAMVTTSRVTVQVLMIVSLFVDALSVSVQELWRWRSWRWSHIYIFDLAKDPVHISDICRWSPVSALAEIPLGGRGPRNLIKGSKKGGGGGRRGDTRRVLLTSPSLLPDRQTK